MAYATMTPARDSVEPTDRSMPLAVSRYVSGTPMKKEKLAVRRISMRFAAPKKFGLTKATMIRISASGMSAPSSLCDMIARMSFFLLFIRFFLQRRTGPGRWVCLSPERSFVLFIS